MQITREQEIALWKLLAESFELTYEKDLIYIGNCPFCQSEDAFGININTNYAGCVLCGKKCLSLSHAISELMKLSSALEI